MQNHGHSGARELKHQRKGTRKDTKKEDLRWQVQRLWNVNDKWQNH